MRSNPYIDKHNNELQISYSCLMSISWQFSGIFCKVKHYNIKLHHPLLQSMVLYSPLSISRLFQLHFFNGRAPIQTAHIRTQCITLLNISSCLDSTRADVKDITIPIQTAATNQLKRVALFLCQNTVYIHI